MKKFSPVMSSLLHNRTEAFILSGALLLHVGATYLNLPVWPCPLFHATGIPCPGCGLSRAIVMLVLGQWQAAIQMHMFAPVFLLAMLGLVIIPCLPGGVRQRLIEKIEQIEMKTGISFVILVSLVVYWAIRLVTSPIDFVQLISNR